MPRQKGRVAAKRPQLARNRIEQLLVVAARKVGAPDRSLKDHVADDRELRRRMMKHDMPRRVPRTVDDVDLKIAAGDRIAIDQPAVGFRSEEHTAELQSLKR